LCPCQDWEFTSFSRKFPFLFVKKLEIRIFGNLQIASGPTVLTNCEVQSMRMKMVCDDCTLREISNEFLALKKAQKIRDRTLSDYQIC